MKKVWAILLSSLLVLTLTACGSNGGTPAPTQGTDGGASTPCTANGEITLDSINEYLNTSADMGEGSMANVVAVVPISHINGEIAYPRINCKFSSLLRPSVT